MDGRYGWAIGAEDEERGDAGGGDEVTGMCVEGMAG